MEETRLLICDGTNIFWRAYHGLVKQAFEHNGNPTFAIYGTLNTISTVIRRESPTHVVIVFDWGKSAYRLEIWPKYKAGRPNSEVVDYEDSENQLTILQDLLPKFGLQVWREKDIEADDILGTITERFKQEVDEIIVVTGDKDMRQLIGSNVIVVHPSLGAKMESRWNEQDVIDHYGVAPNRLPEIWALSGDKVDNIPGIPGVGEKTAIKFIQKYGDLAGVALSDEKKVEGYRHDMKMSERLVTINPQLSSFDLQLENIRFIPVTSKDKSSNEIRSSLNNLGFDKIESRWLDGSLWTERGIRLRDLKSRNTEKGEK